MKKTPDRDIVQTKSLQLKISRMSREDGLVKLLEVRGFGGGAEPTISVGAPIIPDILGR